MNYEKIYYQIIRRAKSRILEGYKEQHHVIPRCMGGTDDTENLVDLTAKEHFICHKLLVEIYPNNTSIKYAFNMMCNRFKQFSISSRHYHEIKQQLKHSNETKKKCSELKKNWWASKLDRSYESLYGKEKAQNLKIMQSINSKSMSDETKKKISEANKRRKYRPMSEETKQKIREKRKLQDMSHLRNKPRTAETKQKISQTKRAKNSLNK